MISQALTVGHTASLAFVYLDQDGNPMLTAPVPDKAPEWTQSNASAATLTPSSDGVTASEKGIAAGTDVVTVSVVVDGVEFAAQGTFNVSAAPQKLTSIEMQVVSVD